KNDRGDTLSFLDDEPDTFDERSTRGHRRTRAHRGVAGDLQRRIAMPVRDLLPRDAEPVGDKTRKHRGVALAGRLYVETDRQRTVAGESEPRPFERRTAGMLQHAGKADAAIFSARAR